MNVETIDVYSEEMVRYFLSWPDCHPPLHTIEQIWKKLDTDDMERVSYRNTIIYDGKYDSRTSRLVLNFIITRTLLSEELEMELKLKGLID